MEGLFIPFVIIVIVFSIVASVARSGKKAQGSQRPADAPRFPPLSFDTPVTPQPEYVPGEYGETAGPAHEGAVLKHRLKELQTDQNASGEGVSYNPSIADAGRADAVARGAVGQSAAEDEKRAAAQAASAYDYKPGGEAGLRLFAGRDEFVRAVVYSEILKPRFRTGRMTGKRQ